MQRNRWFGAMAGIVGCLLLGTAAADELKPIAVFKGAGGPAQGLALSADGSRLVVASTGVVWNVEEKRQVCVCKHAPAYDYVWLSPDGRTLLTASGLGVLTSSLGPVFRVWDAKAGKELFTPPAINPRRGGKYTAAALSPDGKYVALAMNEVLKMFGTKRQYLGGNIVVYDLKTKKVKWKVAGIEEEVEAQLNMDPILQGHVNWLAFSPAADRLAVAGKNLRIFTLEASKETPDVVFSSGLMKDFTTSYQTILGQLVWSLDGQSLALQQGQTISRHDPKTGQGTDRFTLTYPAPERKEPPAGGRLPPPPPPPDFANQGPEGGREHQITLSADGARVAALVVRLGMRNEILSTTVIIWDIQAQRQIALLAVPEEASVRREVSNPRNPGRRRPPGPPTLSGGQNSDVRIALSGDGKRLAVADATGGVKIYDVAQLVASSRKD